MKTEEEIKERLKARENADVSDDREENVWVDGFIAALEWVLYGWGQ